MPYKELAKHTLPKIGDIISGFSSDEKVLEYGNKEINNKSRT